MIELTLPAGSFASALQAFMHGADAVYLGLTSFSARKGAQNFTIEEVAKLKTYAVELGKKIYVTINTLLDDEEIEKVIPLLRSLELIEVDGIIVQDLGLASIIHHQYPSIPLHASTQLAVHTVKGVEQLVALGFSRVVLSRELTIEEVEHIRNSCPTVSLKVFIHGAMCYGFSGLCMASITLTDRSANKGECAQICRSWFTQKGENVDNGYFFSMKDLDTPKESIKRLIDMGIDSLKIEGRMKSPEYVALATQYYRSLIDNEQDDEKIAEIKEELDTSFARMQSGGWLSSYDKPKVSSIRTTDSLITTRYPGHHGVRVGSVIEASSEIRGYYLIKAEREISLRDGLLITRRTAKNIDDPIKFSAKNLLDTSYNTITHLRRGEYGYAEIPIHTLISLPIELRRISLHDKDIKKEDESHYSSYRYPITLTITLDQKGISIASSHLPSWVTTETTQFYPLEISEARKEQPLEQNITTIFSSGLHGKVIASAVKIVNTLELELKNIFIPLSILKEIRRSYYDSLEGIIETSIHNINNIQIESNQKGEILPPRALITPPHNRNLPYVDLERTLRGLKKGTSVEEVLSIIDNKVYLPLPAVTFNEEEAIEQLDEILSLINHPVIIGINNISHLKWVETYREIETFIDVYLYIANSESAASIASLLNNCTGGYYWIEKKMKDTSHYNIKMSEVEKEFSLPLFISRSCYKYDVLGLSCKGCTRDDSYEVTQRENLYGVDIHNCVSIVSKLEKIEATSL